jgi:hypothetical protein
VHRTVDKVEIPIAGSIFCQTDIAGANNPLTNDREAGPSLMSLSRCLKPTDIPAAPVSGKRQLHGKN